MNRIFRLVVIALVIATAWLWIFPRDGAKKSGARTVTSETVSKTDKKSPTSTPVDNSPGGLLKNAVERLRDGTFTPEDLAALRAALLSADPAQAIAAITAFLATGQDVNTGERFGVGSGGELSGAPTLRVLLLDILGRICKKTGGPEAAAMSRALLERKTSADEWAVALRNVGWTTPGERQYLANKVREMLRYEAWRRQPSGGFLESFDVIVFTRDVTFTPDLAELAKDENPALQRAAGIAMDRLAEMSPLEVMNWLNTNPAEFAGKPMLRADYFTKADFTQPAQRQAVETYLSRADVEPKEKTKLLNGIASPGSFTADNLLTLPPPEDDAPEKVAALQKTVGEWVAGNRFPSLLPVLLQLQARLQTE
jgi:hypothetical protein